MKKTPSLSLLIFVSFAAVLCFILVGFVLSVTWRMPIHNFNLWRLENNFQMIASSHPSDSTQLLFIKGVGNLFRGASNACDYFVGEFRISPGSKEGIMRWYKELSIRSFEGRAVSLEVYFIEDDFFKRYPGYEWREKLFRSSQSVPALGVPYLVLVSQSDYPPDGDIRCH